MTHPPSYIEIANDVQRRITEREYPPGTRLPSSRSLAGLHGVSVSTVQRALALLRDRRVVSGRQGRGLFVADEQR